MEPGNPRAGLRPSLALFPQCRSGTKGTGSSSASESWKPRCSCSRSPDRNNIPAHASCICCPDARPRVGWDRILQLDPGPFLANRTAGGGVLVPSPAAFPAPALLLSTASCLGKDDAAGVSQADHLHAAGTETSTAVSSLGSTDPSCKPHMMDPPGCHSGSRHPDPCVEPLLHGATPAPWNGEETMLLSAGKPSRWEIQEGFEETSQPLAEASKIAFVFNWRENSPDCPICQRAWWRARQLQGCRKWVRELQTPWGSCCVS
ncbi:uncharacterized protein LOC126045456 isoform X6 [Accipiter gentilis]|uniref:uncharacterized protein LOC126045456 isoform X6 n=1 Tax=Astur gentilis TaxID=8957 RepID=UPI0021107BD2|nr:uncharacterized protein LOC126045456 isoform X6 [Accipiter gentilis]